MVIVVKGNRQDKRVNELIRWIEAKDFTVQVNEGVQKTILGVVGDTAALDIDAISTFPAVETVKRIQEPYKKANRQMHEEDTVVEVGGRKIGGGHFQVMAGPCSVESKEQVAAIADYVKRAERVLRGGAFKPRSSPYASRPESRRHRVFAGSQEAHGIAHRYRAYERKRFAAV